MAVGQNEKLLEYMKQMPKGHKITTKEAMEELGIYRLGARIFDLKRDGVKIESEMMKVPTRDGTAQVKGYWLGE